MDYYSKIVGVARWLNKPKPSKARVQELLMFFLATAFNAELFERAWHEFVSCHVSRLTGF